MIFINKRKQNLLIIINHIWNQLWARFTVSDAGPVPVHGWTGTTVCFRLSAYHERNINVSRTVKGWGGRRKTKQKAKKEGKIGGGRRKKRRMHTGVGDGQAASSGHAKASRVKRSRTPYHSFLKVLEKSTIYIDRIKPPGFGLICILAGGRTSKYWPDHAGLVKISNLGCEIIRTSPAK